jgi:hypothetical protein
MLYFNETWDNAFKIDPLSVFLKRNKDLKSLQTLISENESLYKEYWSEDDLNKIRKQ